MTVDIRGDGIVERSSGRLLLLYNRPAQLLVIIIWHLKATSHLYDCSQWGYGLPRRLELGLIFSLITLLVQVIAPMSATYAMTNASTLTATPICVHQNNDSSQNSPVDHEKSCPCCTLLCSVAHAAFPAPSDIPTSIAPPQRLPQKLVFKTASYIPTSRRMMPIARPRAPPLDF